MPHALPRPPRARRAASRAAALAAALLSAACASTGATFRSGVGDTMLEHPPYAAGAPAAAVAAAYPRLGHLPVAFQRGAAQAPIFDPANGPDTPVGALLAEMNAYLDSLGAATGVTKRLVEGGRVSAVAHAATRTPPDVRFGCPTATGMAGDECAARGDSALGRKGQRMLLAVGRPAAEWVAWVGEVARDQQVDALLVLTLEVGQYLPRQTGLRGDKHVELGSGYVARLPWLTSLETPVPVLQLTGALVRPDGRAVRIAAEGIAARRTPLLASAAGAQALFGDADVTAARALRRDDLPGRPLAWQAAVRHVLAEVAGGRAAPARAGDPAPNGVPPASGGPA
jgi:hypothetical protein